MFKWSDSDKIVIPVTVLIICIIAVGLYFLTRHRSKWVKKIPLQIISVALIGLEIAKQIYFHNNPEFTYYVLPLHFCSMILILMPLSQLFGEKVGGVFRPMAFIYSILVFILVLANPHALIGDSTSDIFGSFHNIHTYFFGYCVSYIFHCACGLRAEIQTLHKRFLRNSIIYFVRSSVRVCAQHQLR